MSLSGLEDDLDEGQHGAFWLRNLLDLEFGPSPSHKRVPLVYTSLAAVHVAN